MPKKALAASALILLLATGSAAQEVGHFDASIAWGGVRGNNVNNPFSTVSNHPTDSGVVLGTFRFRFNRMNGIALNIAHTTRSQIFTLPPDNYRVQVGITEYSGAYVLSPFKFEKLDPFAFAGAGALRFYPGNTYIDGFQNTFGASQQTSLTFLYGGGADYTFWRALAARVQYRGLIYRQPNFHLQQFVTGSHGQMYQLTVGIVFKF
ncbi:MAG TPA: outer membrane beta-barrel protein [Terriglobales bacterium]|jgi:opacity protein-like surface antigen